MRLLLTVSLMMGAVLSFAQAAGNITREVTRAVADPVPIIREDFQRCEPAESVLLNQRKPDTWLLRTEDWSTPLLNSMGNPPDLTYDPELTGTYDIYLGTRATDFPVSMGIKLSDETEFTTITSPFEKPDNHRDWEFCFRRNVTLDDKQLVIHARGDMVYLDYIKFVPVGQESFMAQIATDHVMICEKAGKHFAFPGLAKLNNGNLAVVFREGTAHIDPSGSVAMCQSEDGGRTWLPRRTIYDNPQVDERDPGICQHSDGTLVVSMHSDGSKTIRSNDGGLTWDTPADAPVFTPHGPGELPDGKLYWFGITTLMGMNHVKIITSEDLGKSWSELQTTAVSLPYHIPWVRPFWDEPHILPLDDKTWLCQYRVDKDGYVYQNTVNIGDNNCPIPMRQPMWGCPPFIMKLSDGRLLSIYGYRQPPFGIRACLSHNNGATWDIEHEIIIRDDGGHVDLGYPTAIEIEPGRVFTVYYFNHGGTECSIEGTFFNIE